MRLTNKTIAIENSTMINKNLKKLAAFAARPTMKYTMTPTRIVGMRRRGMTSKMTRERSQAWGLELC